jgi:hypothetical protein
MRTPTLALAGLVLAAVGPARTVAAADEEYRDGYVRIVEPGVTVQRATEVSAEEAVPNLPFLPGDRVWTDGSGRAEFRFPDGSAVRLDRQSKLDYAGHDEGRDEVVVLRLWSGSLILRNRPGGISTFEIETPGGLARVQERGVFRIDVGAGETWLSAYEGWATLDNGRDRIEVGPGERGIAQWGGSMSGPEGFDRYAGDDFASWDGDLETRESWAASGRRYLPDELSPYAAELDSNGSWAYAPDEGYVWQPYAARAAGWEPYSNGYWAWTPYYGYSWVAYEPWGWAPFHYGSWGFSVSLGWYWSPGRVWGPGWVSWWVGGGRVGWCPLNRHGRPVTPWPRYRGHAVPRGSVGRPHGWSVVEGRDLGRRDISRRRVAADPGAVGAVRFAETGRERPARGGQSLAAASAFPRSAARRPRPADASFRALPASPGAARGSVSRGRPSAPGTGSSRGTGAGTVHALPRSGARSTDSPAAVGSERRIPGMGTSRPPAARGDRGGSSDASRSVPGVGSSRPRPGSTSRSAPGTGTSRPRSDVSRGDRGGGSGTSRSVPGVGTSRPRPLSAPSQGDQRAEPQRRSAPLGSLFPPRRSTGSVSPRSSGSSASPRSSSGSRAPIWSGPSSDRSRSSAASRSRPAPRSSSASRPAPRSSAPRSSTSRGSSGSRWSAPRSSASRSSGSRSSSRSSGQRSSGSRSSSRSGSRGSAGRSRPPH